ncbi:MAG: acylphosphatase [Halobacteriota archaeon]
MKRKRIVIKGEVVQDIGYRLFLYEYAEAVDIPEFQARNIEEGVEVLVGGEGIGIDKYLDFVREEGPERAEIEEIEVEDHEGKIKPIERFAQSFMLAQMGKFVNIGMEMLATEKAIKKDTGMMLEKQDSMLEKQDSMLEKQDETISEIRNVSEKIDQGKEEIVAEISSLREDLRSYMENKFARIEREITEIKMKVGMV